MQFRTSIFQRVVLIAVAWGVFAATPLTAQTGLGSEVENQLQEAERQWQDANANNAIFVMLRIVTQNFVYVNLAGDVLGWEQWLTSVRKLTPEVIQQRKTNLAASRRDLQMVQLLGDTAIVSYRVTDPSGLHTRQTDVWVRMDGFWRLAHEQITKVEPVSPCDLQR